MRDVRGRIARAAQLLSPVALGSLATANERARERHRRLALSAGAAFAARGVAVTVNLVSVPLALGALGHERYGTLVALSSFVAMLAFTDFGVGSALLNLVSEADGRNDRPAIVRYVSSAFVVMTGVAVALLLVFALLYPSVDWAAIFRISGDASTREVGAALAIVFVLFALGIPLGIGQRAQMAYQESFAVSVWHAVGSVAGLIGLVIVVRASAGMPGVALALGGGIVLGAIANCVAFFRARPWLIPSLSAFSSSAAGTILRRGSLFVVLQLAAGLAFFSDSLVADQVLGPEAAARYSVAQRLYFVLPAIVYVAVTPLWPAYSEALARGDRTWVRRTFVRSVVGGVLVVGVGAGVLTIFREPVFSLWVGHDLVPSLSLSIALLLWSILYTWGAPVGILLNAANVIPLQVVCSLSMGAVGLVLKVWFASLFGIDGIVWGILLAYAVLTFVPYTVYLARRQSEPAAGI